MSGRLTDGERRRRLALRRGDGFSTLPGDPDSIAVLLDGQLPAYVETPRGLDAMSTWSILQMWHGAEWLCTAVGDEFGPGPRYPDLEAYAADAFPKK